MAIISVFIVLIVTMVGYNAWALNRQRNTPVLIDLHLRQRSLAERYLAQVLLTVQGYQAEPDSTLETRCSSCRSAAVYICM